MLQVPSAKPAGEVTAQDPPPGTKQPEGSAVHFNVSKGPTPVSVPSVVGEPIDTASSQLQALGFKVSTTFVDSNEPANNVIGQNPAAGASAGKGSSVNLTVSKGPKTSTVPDVTSLDLGSAQQTLHDSGFNRARRLSGHGRSEQRRARARGGSARRHAAEAGRHRDADRRPLARRPTADDDDRHDDDSVTAG